MGTLELLTMGVTVVLAVVGVLVLVAVLRHSPRSAAGRLVGSGDFDAALDSARTGDDADREELLAAAVAAKHVLQLERAEGYAARAIALDRDDGEAWMERGLITAYQGDYARAAGYLETADRLRSDLFESISLHRAWVDLKSGSNAAAVRRFEEISAPLESKLRSDLGPGDPLFAEWFFQAADLWEESGVLDKSAWARREALRSAPSSRLIAEFAR